MGIIFATQLIDNVKYGFDFFLQVEIGERHIMRNILCEKKSFLKKIACITPQPPLVFKKLRYGKIARFDITKLGHAL